MWEWIFSTAIGWIGTAVIVAACCLAVAWLIPPLRPYAVAVAGIFLAAATIYTKGNRDRAKREQEKRDAAVAKLGTEYDQIETRTDDNRARDRLRDGSL